MNTISFNRPGAKSARASLTLIGLIILSVLMCLFAAVSYWVTEQGLITHKKEAWTQFQKRLRQPVANALWVYDHNALQTALDVELDSTVIGLRVVDDVGRNRAHSGQDVPGIGVLLPTDTEVLSVELPNIEGTKMGKVDVVWSNTAMREALQTTLLLSLAQLVVVSVTLLGGLWMGVDRLIFRRLRYLQETLDKVAERKVNDKVVALPVLDNDEFGAITKSINAITFRLGVEIETGKVAGEEARAALSNLQSAQAGLIHAEKMASLGRLVAGVAHELNTPIGNMVTISSAQKAESQDLNDAVAAGTLTRSALSRYASRFTEGSDMLLKVSSRAAELIQNFKQVAVDQSTDQLRTFDLASQTLEVLSVISTGIGTNLITVEHQLEPDISMHSLPGPLGQVMTNLIMNAVLHGFNGERTGVIEVTTKRIGSHACITVTDNGAGIEPEVIGKIFDPFFTTKMGHGGTGLGLHIVHNIVHGLLGGTISVRSEVNVKTIFELHLPCNAPKRI